MARCWSAVPNDRLLGSTGHAPGFVGLLNEVPVVGGGGGRPRAPPDTYDELQHAGLVGFDRVDGLQVATTAGMMTDLQRRAGLAHDAG